MWTISFPFTISVALKPWPIIYSIWMIDDPAASSNTLPVLAQMLTGFDEEMLSDNKTGNGAFHYWKRCVPILGTHESCLLDCMSMRITNAGYS
jgi:hypothetical protein